MLKKILSSLLKLPNNAQQRCMVAEDRNETLEREMQVLINKCKGIGDLAEFTETELKSHEDMPNVKTL